MGLTPFAAFPSLSTLRRVINAALDEDLAYGDLTSSILIPPTLVARAEIIAKGRMIVAGVEVARQVFQAVDSTITLTTHIGDGMMVRPTTPISRIFVAELDPQRLAMAKDLGAETINPREVDTVKTVREMTHDIGVSVAVDAVGTALTRDQCVKALKTTGTLILSGLHEETSAMPIADMIRREITAKGSFSYSPKNFAEALQLLQANKVRLSPWIVEAPLEEGQQWFERLIEEPGGVSKVLLVP
jgi:Zn-dependent alcohol dehydrogenase